jgi:hypothetical protein
MHESNALQCGRALIKSLLALQLFYLYLFHNRTDTFGSFLFSWQVGSPWGDQFFKGIAKETPIFELLNVEKILQKVHQ